MSSLGLGNFLFGCIIFTALFLVVFLYDSKPPVLINDTSSSNNPSPAASSSSSSSSSTLKRVTRPSSLSVNSDESILGGGESSPSASTNTHQSSFGKNNNHRENQQQQQPPPSSTTLFISKPRKIRSSTDNGLHLFDYELPHSLRSSILTVNYSVPSSDWRPKRGLHLHNGDEAHPEHMIISVPIEPVDTTIRLKTKKQEKKCHKLAKDQVPQSQVSACFNKVMEESMLLLFHQVTSLISEHLLPNFVTIPKSTRRVYFDIGARNYESNSTKWFMEQYPESHLFEASSFEMENRFRETFPTEKLQKHFKSWTFENKAVWIHENGIETNGANMGAIVDEKSGKSVDGRPVADSHNNKKDSLASLVGNQMKKQQQQQHNKNKKTVPSIDLSKYLLDNYKKEDFIVIKMDIEGAEWKIMEKLFETGAIELIDEMFFECHVGEAFSVMHPRCVDLINLLRRMGVMCHRWV